MIEEFKFAYEEVHGITSLTLTKKDISYFHNQVLNLLNNYKPKSRYTIIISYKRTSVSDPVNIDFIKFKEPVKALIIEFSVPRVIEMEIYLSTYEKGIEIEGFRSHYRIKSDNEALILNIKDFFDAFFERKRNIHTIVHRYAIYVSIPLSFVVAYYLQKLLGFPDYMLYLLMTVLPFYVFTKSFRWLMPYTDFIEENSLQSKLRYGIATVVLGVLAAGLYDIIKNSLRK